MRLNMKNFVMSALFPQILPQLRILKTTQVIIIFLIDFQGPKSFYVKRKGLAKAITRIRQGRKQRDDYKKFTEGRNEEDAKVIRVI